MVDSFLRLYDEHKENRYRYSSNETQKELNYLGFESLLFLASWVNDSITLS